MDTIRLGARLRAARKAAGFKTSKSLVRKHKIPASTYSQHESGSRTPDDDTLKFYSKIFSVNLDWLKDGKGLPYSASSLSAKNIIKEELLDLSSLKKSTTINEHLLTKILSEIFLEKNTQNITANSIKKIVKEAIKIYIQKSWTYDKPR